MVVVGYQPALGIRNLNINDPTGQDSVPDASPLLDSKAPQKLATDLGFYTRNLAGPAVNLLRIWRDTYGVAYLQVGDVPTVTRIDDPQAELLVRRHGAEQGQFLRQQELKEVMDGIRAYAQLVAEVRDVWLRIGRDGDRLVIDLGDRHHTHVYVSAGKVEVVREGSPTLFWRTETMRALSIPAETGNLALLDKYLNLDPEAILLLKAWIGYVLAHPKGGTTGYPILVLQGLQGSGKTFLCKLIQALIDPNAIGVRTFPDHRRDLAIAASRTHLLMYDNLRQILRKFADDLCVLAMGGSREDRRLFTDAGVVVHRMHAALILNGIHPFLDQADLAQRTLTLMLRPLDEHARRSESALMQQFEVELPVIFRGLLDRIAAVLVHLPTVEPTDPERMFDFSRWLAAMEKVDGLPPGPYQLAYGQALDAAMLDTLQENCLAVAVIDLIERQPDGHWSGTPGALLEVLSRSVDRRTLYSPDWPRNAIALSKRLTSLQPALRRQGIEVQVGRRHEREIAITRVGGPSND